MIRPMLILAVAVLPSAPLFAQESDEARFPSVVINVQVPVTVTAKNGRPVAGLKASDFKLLDNGVEQKFTLDESAHPVSLVVAVQANLASAQVLPQVIAASRLLGPLLAGANGEVAVIGFDHRVQTLTPFTGSADEIRLAFLKMKPGGSQHHLDDAAFEGITMLNTRAKSRKKILLLISQEHDVGSAMSSKDVFERAELDGILVYAISMKSKAEPPAGRARNPAPPEMRAPLPMGNMQTTTTDVQNGGFAPTLSEMREIIHGFSAHSDLEAYATMTGGSQQTFGGQRALEDAMENIAREVHSQYVLTFAPRGPAAGFHNLTVQVAGSKRNVRARRGYRVGETPAAPQVR